MRVAHATRWHRGHLGFLPIAAFTDLPRRVATFISWGRFDHDHVAFVALDRPFTSPRRFSCRSRGCVTGVTALMMGIDGRWSAIRITLESQLIGLALIPLATARAWQQFDTSNALTYVFAAGIALLLIGLAALWSAMMLNKTPRFWAHRRHILVRATEPVRWSRRTRRG